MLGIIRVSLFQGWHWLQELYLCFRTAVNVNSSYWWLRRPVWKFKESPYWTRSKLIAKRAFTSLNPISVEIAFFQNWISPGQSRMLCFYLPPMILSPTGGLSDSWCCWFGCSWPEAINFSNKIFISSESSSELRWWWWTALCNRSILLSLSLPQSPSHVSTTQRELPEEIYSILICLFNSMHWQSRLWAKPSFIDFANSSF